MVPVRASVHPLRSYENNKLSLACPPPRLHYRFPKQADMGIDGVTAIKTSTFAARSLALVPDADVIHAFAAIQADVHSEVPLNLCDVFGAGDAVQAIQVSRDDALHLSRRLQLRQLRVGHCGAALEDGVKKCATRHLAVALRRALQEAH